VFESHDGLARREELLAAGVSTGEIRAAIRRGEWVMVRRGLYGLANWSASPRRDLIAACLATGGAASHASAAWLWGLLERAPDGPIVTVARGQRPLGERKGAATATSRPHTLGLEGLGRRATVHYSTDLAETGISHWQGVPTTNPLRTLVDLAGEAPGEAVDTALDRAVAKGLVTVGGLVAEAQRLGRHGRRGPRQLRRALARRGFLGAPQASVLESQLLRLLAANGIEVVATEVAIDDGSYRIDTQVEGNVFVEVDGYAFHWSPEQKERDEARRNALRLRGYTVLVYGWRAVRREKRRVVEEVLAAQSLSLVPLADTGLDGGALDGGALDGGALDGGALDGGALDGGVLE
jgi:very-short-patch-repair endonuclease